MKRRRKLQPVAINPLVVDLSHHNDVADFGKVKAAGIAGIIHKATEAIPLLLRPRSQTRGQRLCPWGGKLKSLPRAPIARLIWSLQASGLSRLTHSWMSAFGGKADINERQSHVRF